MCTKKFLKVFGLLLVVGLLFAVAPTGQAQAADPCTTACYVSPSGDDTSTGLEGDPFLTIQKAIDTVSDGGTIYLTAGNYVENPITTITLNKSFSLIGANDGSGTALSTIQGTLSLENSLSTDSYLIEYINFKQVSGTDSLVIKQIDNLTVRNSVFAGAGTVTGRAIQMNTGSNGNQNILIDNCRFENLYYTGIQGSVNNLTVKDSEFLNLKSGINLQSGGSDLTVTDSTFSVVAQGAGNDTYGIRLASDTAGTGESLNVTGSTFTVDKAGLVADPGTYHAAIIIRAGALGPFTVEENQILGDVFNLTTLPLDISPNWWGSADGPAAGQLVGTATYIPWCGDAACENLITPTVHNTTKGTWHVTIQGAIDAAADGDVIEVGPGTYAENVVINKPNLTLQSSGTAEETIVLAPTGVGISVLKELGTVTVDGFTVESWTTAGISQSWTQRAGTTFIVKNNIVNGTGDEVHGNCIQVTGDDSLVEGNVVDGAYYTGTGEYGASGILVYLANNAIVRNNVVTNADIGIAVAGGGAYGQSSMTGALVIDNEVSLSEIGISVSFDANNTTIQDNFVHDNELGLLEEYNWGYGPTGTIALHNQVVDNTEQALTESYDETTPIPSGHIFMAEANWWGSIAGPSETEINEYVDYAPWCGDAECSFLVYPMLSTGLQASIDATPAGGTLYVPAGTYTDAVGGFVGGYATWGYQVGGITLILGDGVVIANPDDSCFSITGSHTRILTESIGGAKCVPNGYDTEANSYSHGIVIDPFYVDVQDIVIDGLEIDGTGTNSGSGIYFNGHQATDVQMLNNYIHDLGWGGTISPAMTLPMETDLGGIVDIQGNLFKNVGPVETASWGSGDLNMTYNSWGRYSVQAADVYMYDAVIFDPWTYAAIELSSTNPTVDNWENQVLVDDQITYEVIGVFQNITGADFTLTYDPAKLEVVSITPVANIFTSADGDLVDELVEGQIRYDGVTYPGFTSTDANGTLLYTVTFKALVSGDVDLAIDPASDLFGMIPPSGPSTNVYPSELDSVSVHVIDRPTLTPTNLGGLYVVDVSHEISTVIANPATGGVWTESPTEPDAIGWIRISDALVSDITQLQFKYTDGVWYDFSVQDQYGGQAVQQDGADVIARFGNYNFGFDMPNDWSDVDAFRVTFAEAGTHTVTIGIYDMMDTAENFYGTDDILLTEITQMITVYNPPTVSSDDIQGYYLTGEERIFNVSMDNPEALDGGADYALLIFDYRLDGVSTTDITSFEYYAQDLGAWIDMGSRAYETYGDCTEGVGICGQFGWAPGGFGPIAAGFENISQFRINFANSFSTPLNFTLELSGKLLVTDAEWTPLTTFTGTLDVYDKPIITIETDQYFIVNEPGQFAVTIENPATGRPYGNNIVFDVVIPDHLTTDFGTMSCGFGTTTWPVTLESDGAGGVKARILGLDPEGRFDVGAPFGPMTVTCTATLLTAGNYAPSWSMVDMTLDPTERVVQTGTGSMIAYTAPVITAAFPTGPYAAGVPVTVPVSITNPDGIPGPFELILDLPAGTTFTFGGNTYTCDLTGCPAIPLTTLPITDSELVITFAESFTGDIDFTLTDTTWTPDRVLATLTQGVVVGGDYTVTGTFSMQGRTKRAGVEVTFTWGGNSYTVTEETIEQISNNLVAILKYGGDYTITVNQARYLDITTAHGAHINPATALSLVLDSLELRAGDADDDNDVDLDDATIVGGLYGTGTIADRGDINFDNRVNIQDLALIGGNYELQSTTPTADYYAYGDWMQ